MHRLTTLAQAAIALSVAPLAASADLIRSCPEGLNDAPVVPRHIEQADINSGAITFSEVNDIGEALFVAKFNACDGQGRPATTGGGDKRVADEPAKLRTSAPDSDACGGCHAQPEPGGAGDFVANVFVLAQTLDPVTFSVAPVFSNDRNTLGMHGSGPIEMLAREMTVDLQSQAAGLPDGDHTLTDQGGGLRCHCQRRSSRGGRRRERRSGCQALPPGRCGGLAA